MEELAEAGHDHSRMEGVVSSEQGSSKLKAAITAVKGLSSARNAKYALENVSAAKVKGGEATVIPVVAIKMSEEPLHSSADQRAQVLNV